MSNDSATVRPEPLLNDAEAAQYRSATSINASIPSFNLLQFKLQYSREEAAELLSIGVRTLDRLIAEKELPVRRIGRRVLITRDALEKFTKKDHQTSPLQ